MTSVQLPEDQVDRGTAPSARGRIVLVVLDGLGGLPHGTTGLTELETATTPHLDALAARSSLGLLQIVAPGITPGSGPGHLSLFGYDATRWVIGRGALSALGVGLEMQPGDVAARLNLATFDEEGRVVDRRAGRPSDDEARWIVSRLEDALDPPPGVKMRLVPEKEHRVVLHLRGDGLSAGLTDTDPVETGVPDLPCTATDDASKRTAEIVRAVLARAREVLADEPIVNGLLARGFAGHTPLPSVKERFGLGAVALARYPMYRGVARLVGMHVDEVPSSNAETVTLLEKCWGDHDFYFLHFKDPDTRGHDGDFDGKVAAIEEVDGLLPAITALQPDVLIVTGDHSTPTQLAEHSWHHVPTLIASRWARPSAERFGESACRAGDLGVLPATDLMALALAHAGRLDKYGA